MAARNPQHGGMLPLAMVAIVVITLLFAGAISIGRLGVVKRELQDAADAVALQGSYRLERYGLPTNTVGDLAPAADLAAKNITGPVEVRWVGFGDEGARPRQYSYVQIEVATRNPFTPTSSFRELLSLRGRVRATARARVDEDIFTAGDITCDIINNRFVHQPLGCRVRLTRPVTDQYQLTPHAYRRDGSGREERLLLRDFFNSWLYLDINECETYVALRELSCAPRTSNKLVVRYNKPVLVQ